MTIDEWNDRHKVGTEVARILSGGEVTLAVTSGKAYTIGGLAVVPLRGVDGPVLLERLRVTGFTPTGLPA